MCYCYVIVRALQWLEFSRGRLICLAVFARVCACLLFHVCAVSCVKCVTALGVILIYADVLHVLS